MSTPTGEWRLVQAQGQAARYDWVPAEQPPPPNGHAGVWHVVGAETGAPGRWEWHPYPLPTAVPAHVPVSGHVPAAPTAAVAPVTISAKGRLSKRQRRLAMVGVFALGIGTVTWVNRDDDDALARLANTQVPKETAVQGPKEAAGVDISKPITANSLLLGNLAPTYPAGEADRVAVVRTGKLVRTVGSELVVVVRNNTARPVASVQVAAAGRDMAGQIQVTGAAQGSYPAVLAPGELGLAYVVFKERVRSDLDFTFTTTSSTPAEGTFGDASGKVTEANRVGNTLVGTITNTTGRPLQGPYAVAVFCLSKDGAPTSVQYSFDDLTGNVAPGDVRPFSVRIYGDTCRRYIVGSRSFYA